MLHMQSVAVIYVRVSTEDQVAGTSLDTQERDCRRWCVDKVVAVDQVFREAGASAKTADRKVFLEMIEHCRRGRGRITHVVIWKTDRFSRNAMDYALFRGMLSGWGIQIASVTEAITDDPAGRLMETLLAGIAQFDNDVRAQRTITAMTSLIQDGYWTYRAPLGYRTARRDGKPILDEDPRTGPIVRRAFEKIAAGLWNANDARHALIDAGVRVSESRAAEMWKDSIYCGLICTRLSGPMTYRAKWKPLIDEITFSSAQAHLATCGTRPRYSTTPDTFPWKGALFCEECARPLTSSRTKGRGGRIYPYYQCPGGHARMSVTECERQVGELLDEIPVKFGASFDLLIEVVEDIIRHQEARLLAESGRIQAERDRIDTRRNRLIDAHVDGRLTAAEFDDAKTRLEKEVVMLKIERVETDIDLSDVEAIFEKARIITQKVRTVLFTLPPMAQRDMLLAIFPSGIRTAGRKVRTGLSSSIFNEIDALLASETTMAPPTGFEPVLPG